MQLALLLASAFCALAHAQSNSGSSGAAATSGAAPAASTDVFGAAGVCFPKLNDGSQDTSSPCFQSLILEGRCENFEDSNGTTTGSGATPSGGLPVSSLAKRILGRSLHSNHSLSQECVCKPNMPGSAYWENLIGCAECLRLHGLKDQWEPVQLISAASSSFCATASPTAALGDFIQAFASTASTPPLGTSTVTNVLGTSTAISDYFTSTASNPAATSSAGASATSKGGVPAMTQAPWSGAALVGVLGVAAFL